MFLNSNKCIFFNLSGPKKHYPYFGSWNLPDKLKGSLFDHSLRKFCIMSYKYTFSLLMKVDKCENILCFSYFLTNPMKTPKATIN